MKKVDISAMAEEIIKYEYDVGDIGIVSAEGHHVKWMIEEVAKKSIKEALNLLSQKIKDELEVDYEELKDEDGMEWTEAFFKSGQVDEIKTATLKELGI